MSSSHGYAPDDDVLASILRAAKVIAVVGLSSNPERHSFEVAGYLKARGYRIIPVNPHEAEVLGEPAYRSLEEVPEEIDVVDVFRRPEDTPEIARQAVARGAGTLWLQNDIVSDEARRIAEEGGLHVVMGVCIRTTHRRLEV